MDGPHYNGVGNGTTNGVEDAFQRRGAADRGEYRQAAGASAEALMDGPHYNGVGNGTTNGVEDAFQRRGAADRGEYRQAAGAIAKAIAFTERGASGAEATPVVPIRADTWYLVHRTRHYP
jgi:hypothetical protein